MESKILEGVKPFNDFWYKSCYYHQLIAGLSILGLDGKDILLNDFAYFGNKFDFENNGMINEKLLSKSVGYKVKHGNMTEKLLIKNINKGYPIILGVDCYYLETRKDTYKNTHVSHFILAYGYNLKNRIVNIVDHNYINSFAFEEKIMSLDNLLEANKKYEQGICKEKKTSIILLKRKNILKCDLLKNILEDKLALLKSKKNIIDDFNNMKDIFASGEDFINNNYDLLIKFIEKTKASRLSLSKTRIIEVVKVGEILKELVSCYTFFTALLWKSFNLKNFNYSEERLNKILSKIDKTKELECLFYEKIIEVKYE